MASDLNGFFLLKSDAMPNCRIKIPICIANITAIILAKVRIILPTCPEIVILRNMPKI